MLRMPFAALLFTAACGCAAAPAPTPVVSVHVDLNPSDYLLRWTSPWQANVARPPENSAALKGTIRDLRGEERHEATLRYLSALVYEMDEAGEDERREGRREVRWAVRRLRRAQGELAAARDFLEVVAAWRSGLPRALRLAERFTSRHGEATILHELAWMILGELYFEAERWPDAARSYRFLLGDLNHRLYAFASWRTAAVLRAQGRADEADAMLPQIVRLACPTDTPESTREIAMAAASEANIARRGEEFEVCDEGRDNQSGNLENELPPAFR